MFVKVIFHGVLKKLCPDVYEVDASTPIEAIRGVTNQLRDKLIRRDGHRFICSVKECKTDLQFNSSLNSDELNIFPAFYASGGGNKGGVTTMVIGAILAVVGAVMVGAGVYFGQPWLIQAGLYTVSAGKLLMLAGAIQYFMSPKTDTGNTQENPESSKTFGNQGNTTKIGTRIPVGYGRYKIAGQYLSINTQTVDVANGLTTTYKKLNSVGG